MWDKIGRDRVARPALGAGVEEGCSVERKNARLPIDRSGARYALSSIDVDAVLKVTRNRREGGGKTRPDHGDGADNNDGDESCYQAIFDSRGATVVLEEACDCRHLNCSGEDPNAAIVSLKLERPCLRIV